MNDDIRNDVEKSYNKLSKASTWTATVTAGLSVAIATALVTSIFFSDQVQLSKAELTKKVLAIESRLEAQDDTLSEIQASIKDINAVLSTFASLPESKEWSLEARKLEKNITDNSVKLTALESALTVNPAKALAVPILRKDLDNAEKSIRAELSLTKSNIDRIYDQNKWFIGLMFTIAISVFGVAIGSFFKK